MFYQKGHKCKLCAVWQKGIRKIKGKGLSER